MIDSRKRFSFGAASAAPWGAPGWFLVVAALGVGGCDTAKPVMRGLVQFSDLGVTGPAPEPNRFTAIETQPSIGRFPAGVAVARTMLEDAGAGERPTLTLDVLTNPEALYWNELWDSIPKIREVIVVDPQSLPQKTVTVSQLLAAARRLRCRLCVIYGQNDVADNASQVLGAVYDADTGELIGTVFAEETVDPREKRPPLPGAPDGDKRNTDAHWLAARKFEQLTRAFVLELIDRDRDAGAPPETTTQPAAPGPAPVQSGS